MREITAVELLAWTYRDQQAHRAVEAGLFGAERVAAGLGTIGRSADGVARCMELGLLGVRVDEFGPGSGDLHPDAEAVHQVVVRMRAVGNMLLRHAKVGTVPDWGQGMRPRMEPLWKGEPRHDGFGLPVKGSYRMIWDAARNPIACSVQATDHFAYRDMLRRGYDEWFAGVEAVYRAFSAIGLRSHRLTGLGAKPAPWDG